MTNEPPRNEAEEQALEELCFELSGPHSLDEIGARLGGLSSAVVRRRLRRAIRKLRAVAVAQGVSFLPDVG